MCEETTQPAPERLEAGQVYRNRVGAVMTVTAPAGAMYRVLGSGLWVGETENPGGMPLLWLVTSQWLKDAGYALEPAGAVS